MVVLPKQKSHCPENYSPGERGINLEEYVSNSKKAKQETGQEDEHRVGQIVTSPVKSRKKSGIRKLSELILQEDTSNVKTYIIMDVLIPAAKKA